MLMYKKIIYFNVLMLGCFANADTINNNITIQDELGDDQIEESIELRVENTLLATLTVNAEQVVTEFKLASISHPQHYQLSGSSLMKPAQRRSIVGSGVLIPDNYIQNGMLSARNWPDLHTEWGKLVTELSQKEKTIAELQPIVILKKITEDDIKKAENRLNIKLPDFYRQTMLEKGAWQVGPESMPTVQWLAPDQLISAVDWVQKHNGKIEWNSTTGAESFQKFSKDIVFATTSGLPWVLRYGTALCPDGTPSLDQGYLDHEEFLAENTDPYSNYIYGIGACGNNKQLENASYYLASILTDVLAEKITLLKNGKTVTVERYYDEEPDQNIFTLYLQGAFF